ncbi:putative ATP-grasp-modified RiPP [Kribbella solani]|uniref:putative ATP-grasp-modified RiPP n=1 Tax=Kribbella solani TaxID=236067 RepID=UPI0029BC4F87|nr:putative ATP-grasp-modified RiPP [Kribbella solani]MDX3003591.1 putative ATP-grasp-modified RiPP [Kribbella solani]
MYRYADRIPLAVPSDRGAPDCRRPWGLTRLEPFLSLDQVDEAIVGLDPKTQLGRYVRPDGTVTMAPGKHSRSRRGTERGTKTGNRKDGSRPGGDSDHEQDTKLD